MSFLTVICRSKVAYGAAVLALLLTASSARAADATSDTAAAASNTTTKLDGTGDITITPPADPKNPTKISLTASGKAVTAPTEKKKATTMTVADFLNKIAAVKQWKVTYMPAAARLAAQVITIPDAPKPEKPKDGAGKTDATKSTDDTGDDSPKPVDVTGLTEDEIRRILRAGNLVMIRDSELQDQLRECGATVSVAQLKKILEPVGTLQEGQEGTITWDEAAMLANMPLPSSISWTDVTTQLTKVQAFNAATYHIACADGELAVMRHERSASGDVARLCILADNHAKQGADVRQGKLTADLKAALNLGAEAVLVAALQKKHPSASSPSTPVAGPAGKFQDMIKEGKVDEGKAADLAHAVATDLQIAAAHSDSKPLAKLIETLATEKVEGAIKLALKSKQYDENILGPLATEDVHQKLFSDITIGLKTLAGNLADEMVRKVVTGSKVTPAGLADASTPSAQTQRYKKASLTLTKRDPEAVLILTGLLASSYPEDGLNVELVPLDGDGRFLVYFPLEHAWSQQATFARPYATSSTDPTLMVAGLVDLVKGAVSDYSGNAGIPVDVSAKLVPDPGLDVVQAITVPATAKGGQGTTNITGNSDGNKNPVAKEIQKISDAVLASVKQTVSTDLKGEAESNSWTKALKALSESANTHAASLGLLRMILPPPGYKVEAAKAGGDSGSASGSAASGSGTAAKSSDTKGGSGPASSDINQTNNTLIGKNLPGVADNPLIVVNNGNGAGSGDAAAAAPAFPITAPNAVIMGPPAAPRGARIPTLFAGQVNADVANNAIVVVCPPFDPDPAFGFMTFLDGLMSRLDEPLRMIEISVAIVDLQSTKGEDWGTSFATVANGQIGNKPAFGVAGYNLVPNSTSTTPNPVSGSLSPTGSGAVPALSSDTVAGQGIAVSGLVVGSTVKLLASFHALETANEAQMLARPSVLTTDNSEAIITEETKLYLSAKGLNTGVLTEVPSGLAVAVTPQIVMLEDKVGKKREAVRMRIKIKEGGSDPVASQGIVAVDNSQLKTMAVVEKNQSLLVAGRLHRDESNVDSHIPVLGRIPLLGRAFKNTTLSKNRNQRLVLITPTIVDPRTYHSEAANQAAESMLVPAGQSVLDPSLFPRESAAATPRPKAKKSGK